MKILAVGDLHGKDRWKKINPEEHDYIVFMGDYVDSFTVTPDKILDNLKELIDFRKKHPDKVILLLGNRDIQYMDYPHYRCTGFNSFFQMDYTELFRANRNLFRVASQFRDYLFTHAGLSNSFARHNLKEYYDSILNKEISVAELLNRIQNSEKQAMLHSVSDLRGGPDPFGGITWADYRETSVDLLPGYHQVVGHTPQKKITKVEGEDCSMVYIDVLDTLETFFATDI